MSDFQDLLKYQIWGSCGLGTSSALPALTISNHQKRCLVNSKEIHCRRQSKEKKNFFLCVHPTSFAPFLSLSRCKLSLYLCMISVTDEPEVAADGTSDQPEQPGSTDDFAATKPQPPPDMKTPLSMDSPSRRATRSRIKLAANFSFTAGLWSFSHTHTPTQALLVYTECNSKYKSWPATTLKTLYTDVTPEELLPTPLHSDRLLYSSAFFLNIHRPSLFPLFTCFTISVFFRWR